MYEGAYAQKRKPVRRRRRRTQRPTLLLAALVLIFGALVGSTVAFLVAGTQTVTNEFKPTKVTTTVVENFDGEVKNNVKVQNTGEIPVYIRAAVVVTWQNNEGQVYAQTPVEGTDYTLTWNTRDWFKEGDFWYYKSAVPAGQSTEILLTNCKPVEGQAPEDYYLCVEILASAIQSEPASAVKTAWGVEVDDLGYLSNGEVPIV